MKKPIWKSKTLWVNVIALIALAAQLQMGFVISAEAQLGILAVIDLVLRFATTDPIL